MQNLNFITIIKYLQYKKLLVKMTLRLYHAAWIKLYNALEMPPQQGLSRLFLFFLLLLLEEFITSSASAGS